MTVHFVKNLNNYLWGCVHKMATQKYNLEVTISSVITADSHTTRLDAILLILMPLDDGMSDTDGHRAYRLCVRYCLRSEANVYQVNEKSHLSTNL